MRTQLGLEVFFEAHLDRVAGLRFGLLACPSSVDSQLRGSVDRLHSHPALNLVALFGPEHGIRGDAQAGSLVASAIDPRASLPVYSLYGESKSPTAEMLADLDVILIDLQDAGARFYTFLATTLYVMRAAKAAGVAVILLDRPAPIGGMRVEGPLLDRAYASFVGPYPLPIRYGMTIGEVALFVNEREIGCELTVIPMRGWSRAMWFDETGLPFIPSSPNLPTLEAVTLYPGTCLVEGTNLSEGRGTTRPFEYIGAPWIDAESLADELNERLLAGLRFRPVYFVPTFSKYQGELCAGAHVYVTDRDALQPVNSMLHILQTLKRRYPDEFAWRQPWSDGARPPIDLLWGSDSLRNCIDSDQPVDSLIESWEPDTRDFERNCAEVLLYS
ncbi:MAG: DUF1343 domain-containing protein [Chloroflexi bacterium]|nr:DUF1343 domain-containing protein [Chloroflexota bacterium]